MEIIKKNNKQNKKPLSAPQKILFLESSKITMEYLIYNQTHVKNLLKKNETKLKEITRMKTCPNHGLAANGLGKYFPNSDAFKQFNL